MPKAGGYFAMNAQPKDPSCGWRRCHFEYVDNVDTRTGRAVAVLVCWFAQRLVRDTGGSRGHAYTVGVVLAHDGWGVQPAVPGLRQDTCERGLRFTIRHVRMQCRSSELLSLAVHAERLEAPRCDRAS